MNTETKAQHTPGPWEVRPSSNPKNGSKWRDIVSLGAAFSPSYVGEALEQDAHLIAAAPKLLERCKRTAAYLRGLAARTRTPEVQLGLEAEAYMLEAAIAEAEPAPVGPCLVCGEYDGAHVDGCTVEGR